MKRGFGELELAVLEILKNAHRMTVKEVQAKLGSSDKYTTIMTVMNRLAEKHQLAREKVGAHYEYWIAVKDAEAPTFIQTFMQKIFGLKTGKLISHLVDTSDITDEELLELEHTISKAKESRKKR